MIAPSFRQFYPVYPPPLLVHLISYISLNHSPHLHSHLFLSQPFTLC